MINRREYLEGALYTFANDKEHARSAFQRARPILEKAIQEGSDDASRHMMLGMVLAGLGEKDAAIAEGKRAVELLPESQDALGWAKDDCSRWRKFTPGRAKTTQLLSFLNVH